MDHLKLRSVLAALALSAGACATEPTAPATAASLFAEVSTLVGDAACDSSAQCHSVAIGAKACGGPDRYLAWSSKRTDGARLMPIVRQHAALRRAEDQAQGMQSNCKLEVDPGAVCHLGRCQPGTGQAGSQLR